MCPGWPSLVATALPKQRLPWARLPVCAGSALPPFCQVLPPHSPCWFSAPSCCGTSGSCRGRAGRWHRWRSSPHPWTWRVWQEAGTRPCRGEQAERHSEPGRAPGASVPPPFQSSPASHHPLTVQLEKDACLKGERQLLTIVTWLRFKGGFPEEANSHQANENPHRGSLTGLGSHTLASPPQTYMPEQARHGKCLGLY